MEIIPEIIATKIWKWEWDPKLECWVSEEGHRYFDVTFEESEWTGPLLEKARLLGHYMLRWSVERQEYLFALWPPSDHKGFDGENKSLNLAIAEAILEAEGK